MEHILALPGGIKAFLKLLELPKTAYNHNKQFFSWFSWIVCGVLEDTVWAVCDTGLFPGRRFRAVRRSFRKSGADQTGANPNAVDGEVLVVGSWFAFKDFLRNQ